MNKVLPDPPLDPAKDRAAFNRAITAHSWRWLVRVKYTYIAASNT